MYLNHSESPKYTNTFYQYARIQAHHGVLSVSQTGLYLLSNKTFIASLLCFVPFTLQLLA